MSVIIHYSNVERKIAPKSLKCTDCRLEIEKGQFYFRHGHGRYCPKCNKRYIGGN